MLVYFYACPVKIGSVAFSLRRKRHEFKAVKALSISTFTKCYVGEGVSLLERRLQTVL